MRVFIAADVEPRLIELLRADERFALIDDVAQAEVLITRTINKVDAAMLDRAPDLCVIAQGTSGTDNIDVDAASARGIDVINLPGVNANAVAELVIGHIIALTRTVPRYVREMTNGQWQRRDLRHAVTSSATMPWHHRPRQRRLARGAHGRHVRHAGASMRSVCRRGRCHRSRRCCAAT
jgi:phosphoglycerate dehydrogenase-like enzyme